MPYKTLKHNDTISTTASLQCNIKQIRNIAFQLIRAAVYIHNMIPVLYWMCVICTTSLWLFFYKSAKQQNTLRYAACSIDLHKACHMHCARFPYDIVPLQLSQHYRARQQHWNPIIQMHHMDTFCCICSSYLFEWFNRCVYLVHIK